ncbi:MAG: hypothetical protein JNK82_38235 [Myxococcaceae bacterium]|nr:hypothetical protein [Myxococcaceae bacterium]
MNALWLIAAVAVSQITEEEEVEHTLDRVADMNGEHGGGHFRFLQPLSVSAGAIVSDSGAAPVVALSVPLLRSAGSWGESRLFTLDGYATPQSLWAGATLLTHEQFFCRDPETGGFQGSCPVPRDDSPKCLPNAHAGWFIELARVWARFQVDHVAMRIAEGGLFYDVLGTGRTPQVRATRLQLMLGGAGDAVWFQRNSAATVRGVAKIRGTVSSDSRRLRASLEAAWRPSLIAFTTDQLVEGTLVAGVYAVPELDRAVFIRVRARVSYATRPGMTVSEWADPTAPLTAGADVGVELSF